MSAPHLTIAEAMKLGIPVKPPKKNKSKAVEPKLCDSFRVTTDPVKIRLMLPPPLNHYYQTAVIGKHAQTYISKLGKEFRKHVIEEWPKQAGRVTFEGRLAMRVEIVFKNGIQGDLDGYMKALWDALEHAGAYRNDKQIKLLIVNQERTEAPGWVDVTIGPKPGANNQGNLFSVNW